MPDGDALQRLAELQGPALRRFATGVADFDFGDDAEFGSARTVYGLRAGSLTFSRRHDSLTVFGGDDRHGHGHELGAWTGSEDELLRTARQSLLNAGIPESEIDDLHAISEFGAAAERVSENEFRAEDPEVLQKLAIARRVVEGIPVWPSYARVALTAEGRIGRLEIHWPQIPPPVAEEAALLSELVARGARPPDVPGGTPESVEAGVLHSSAIGFFMDVVAAIRVTYRAEDPTLGRKAVLFLDRHGEPVAPPRDIAHLPVETVERPASNA
jgi:hypothetical protein